MEATLKTHNSSAATAELLRDKKYLSRGSSFLSATFLSALASCTMIFTRLWHASRPVTNPLSHFWLQPTISQYNTRRPCYTCTR